MRWKNYPEESSLARIHSHSLDCKEVHEKEHSFLISAAREEVFVLSNLYPQRMSGQLVAIGVVLRQNEEEDVGQVDATVDDGLDLPRLEDLV